MMPGVITMITLKNVEKTFGKDENEQKVIDNQKET